MSEDMCTVAQRRLDEAKALLAAQQWSGAYYLAGYAVECGLKAVISKDFAKYQIPDKDLMNKVYTHKLDELFKLADLQTKFTQERGRDSTLDRYWTIVKVWSESSRYETHPEQLARDMVTAVEDSGSGVLQWIQKQW
ncbi:hypothetical protein [Nocardia sp. NPDC056100]|uniref:hypothetical protein n=1 Tax=Nocardia sp. NPDC056100 TaxID=3345712 RepID=UPI0035DC5AF2